MKQLYPIAGRWCGKTTRTGFCCRCSRLAERREALWALFAFNYEIAKTREVVSETALGLARLQWWREAIGNIYGGGEFPQHEILKALAPAIKTHGLTSEYFDTLVYAREFDLENICPRRWTGF
jgi:NADH dehydrogenase [ubiquinone] 1 alpha subcomplex assembly factor 6